MPSRYETAFAASTLRPYRHYSAILLRGAAIGIGLVAAGCAGMPLPDPLVTGSVTPRAVSVQAPAKGPGGVPAEDWAYANQALNEALSQKSGVPSVPWENAASATRGTATPVGDVVAREGTNCREFLVSFVRASGEQWLQGEACRAGTTTAWKVDQARLLQRT